MSRHIQTLSTHFEIVEKLGFERRQGTQRVLCIENFRQFALQTEKNQLLGFHVLKEPREIGTHVVIRKQETFSIRIVEEFDNVFRISGLVPQTIGAT